MKGKKILQKPKKVIHLQALISINKINKEKWLTLLQKIVLLVELV